MFKWWLFTIFKNIHKFIIQRQYICLNYFKNTLSNIIVYCTITGSLKIIDSWQISRKLKIRCQNIPLFERFHEISGKNSPISPFCEIRFKIPIFSWNLEHILDHSKLSHLLWMWVFIHCELDNKIFIHSNEWIHKIVQSAISSSHIWNFGETWL